MCMENNNVKFQCVLNISLINFTLVDMQQCNTIKMCIQL